MASSSKSKDEIGKDVAEKDDQITKIEEEDKGKVEDEKIAENSDKSNDQNIMQQNIDIKESNEVLTVSKDIPSNITDEDESKNVTTNMQQEDSGKFSLSDDKSPGSSLLPNYPKQDSDLRKLHDLCSQLSLHQSVDQENSRSQTTDSILQLLVTEDMSSVRSSAVLKSLFVDYLHLLPPKVISEFLSVLIAIVKKSVFHLESARGLLIPSINHLLFDTKPNGNKSLAIEQSNEQQTTAASSTSLTKHFLREWVNLLIAHSCDVEELKSILQFSNEDPSLLSFIQQANLKQRNRPPAFFAFPGTKGSMMSLPPFQKWPIQVGWSFSTWFFLEPKACAQPYLYNFKTGKSGLGYSAHFTGNCLVLTSIRVKGKGVQHCIAYEFPSYKWIHCAITYHNKWRSSEIKVYINGQLSANIEMAWQVQTTEMFDKCFIGGSGSITSTDRTGELNCFCGQMAAIYLFNEGLSPAQICAIHRLSASYTGQFKYSNESHVNLPPQVCRVLYEEKLASALFCLFTPVAVDSGALCIQLAPFKSSTTVSAQNYFISAPHAALMGQTKAIITQPICATLQSLGFSRSLLPLLEVFAAKNDPEACSSLIEFLCDLLESSPHWFANEIVQNNGFVIIACSLSSNPRSLLTERSLDIFLNLTRTLLTTSSTVGDSLLLKHLMDNILFNHTLWVYADPKLQIRLYTYLATEFLNGTRQSSNRYTASNSTGSSSAPSSYVAYNPTSSVPLSSLAAADEQSKSGIHENSSSSVTDLIFGEVRRVSTVLQSLHALKYFYWIVEEKGINPKARNYKLRPDLNELLIIRSQILIFTKELMVRANTVPLDEVQGYLNYLSSCTHCGNLLDVLEVLSYFLRAHPNLIVPAFEQKQGIKVLFNLIGSKSKDVRIHGLKMLGLFLSQCKQKRKQDIMSPNNLFTLLFDKLRPYKPLTLGVYDGLIDIMLEVDLDLDRDNDDEQNPPTNKPVTRDLSKMRVENSVIVKVIATLLHDERNHPPKIRQGSNLKPVNANNNIVDIRSIFINDLWNLIVNSKENRRTILQMSVWQHWLINLIDSTISDSQLVRDQVLSIFRVLLYHAIRYEFGGWRVWIDTLAIIHTKVSYDEFNQQLNHPELGSNVTGTINNDLEVKDEKIAGTTSQSANEEIVEDKKDSQGELQDDREIKKNIVSSISEHVPRESSGILMNETKRSDDNLSLKEDKLSEELHEVDLNSSADPSPTNDSKDQPSAAQLEGQKANESVDSVDLAPSRAYRKLSFQGAEQPAPASTSGAVSGGAESPTEMVRQPSLTSIPLEGSSNEGSLAGPEEQKGEMEKVDVKEESDNQEANKIEDEARISSPGPHVSMQQAVNNIIPAAGQQQQQKATASPAFRIPEFRWGAILTKLLNDLMFSIECDLYHWRCSAKCTNLDTPPFVPKSATSGPSSGNQLAASAASGGQSSATAARTPLSSTSSSSLSTGSMYQIYQIESILQRPENQIYITNVVHFISQLTDNIIIAAGGLLPLLADATGGARSSSATTATSSSSPDVGGSKLNSSSLTSEGLTLAQANSLLYRLINMADVVIFAASHINLNELEVDKNTTSGGILRQCLRLACTVTVKNCLVVRSLNQRISTVAGGQVLISSSDFPKDMFDSYQGCSLLSANGLFEGSALALDSSDLIADVEYSPHQTPNTSAMPSLLPFQSVPIRDPNKLLQAIDISRIQACIYHEFSTESRQSQFLALSSLYFISVLMVSKYRDIIEPKSQQRAKQQQQQQSSTSEGVTGTQQTKDESSTPAQSTGFQNGSSVSNMTEANLLSFGKMQPNSSAGSTQGTSGSSSSALTDMLTTKLENTLDTVCPLLKSIMCDFSAFLSKTLIGSHGQDLVNKEADRTFRRQNTSPVELVMLLCSQEWQNTLQKNAGLAFIELINEGRVLSHGMKDHIVRVAMEAEFILSRLRADDVAKHEQYNEACAEAKAARIHEEVLINSLISSATRRDYVIYCKFRETCQQRGRRNYKLDVWEDDDRRKRRFIVDSWDDGQQNFYSSPSVAAEASDSTGAKTKVDPSQSNRETDEAKQTSSETSSESDTKRILELQQTIELGGINDHCSPAAGANLVPNDDELRANFLDLTSTHNSKGELDQCEPDNEDFEEEEDEDIEGEDGKTNSPDSDNNNANDNNHHQLGHKKNISQIGAAQVAAGGKLMDGSSYPGEQLDVGAGKQTKGHHASFYNSSNKQSNEAHDIGSHADAKDQVAWEYEDCGSVNDFTGSVIFAAECSLIWNIYAIPGVFQLTAHELYFEPNQNISDLIDRLKREANSSGGHDDLQQDCATSTASGQQQSNLDSSSLNGDQINLRKLDLKVLRYCDFLTCNGKVSLNEIRAIFSRHYLLQPHALEIFLAQRSSVMFAFADFDTVKRAVKYLPPVGVGIKYGIPQTRRASLMAPRQLFATSNMTQKWQRREIGNFQYLMFLNTISGRTYQDLNQYPVYPWILTNYESEELDLNLPTNFRDLSKPVGALNAKRRAEFIERYQSWDNPKVPAFHYGTHYSTAAFTLNWLCRLRGAPNSAYLALQDGKYEADSRLFLSIGDSWVSSLTGGQQNVKELIPEFFYLPEMFHSNLGLPEVELPAWAKSGEQFVRLHRLALESELVSCQLHQWIDLIFGYKQRGPEAINAINTFYYLTYQGNVNLNMIQDPALREAIEAQIKHFGQTPSQLTTEPHPPRFSALHASPMVFSSSIDEVNKVVKFPFNTAVVHISSCISNYIAPSSSGGSGGQQATASTAAESSSSTGTVAGPSSAQSPSSILTITSNNQYQIHKWMPNEQSGHPFCLDPQLEQGGQSAHRRQLIDVDDLCSGISLKLHNYNTAALAEAHGCGDTPDEVQWPCAHHNVTLDGRYIIMGSFYDNSFRVFATESGKLCQVIYGHRGPITCIARSDCNAAADFYVATGSQDCSVLLWTWNERYAQIEGSGVSAVHNPLPKLTISGHQSPVLSVVICAELGLIISGSKNLILVHTTTTGENILEIDVRMPDILEKTACESGMHQFVGDFIIERPQVKDKQRTILEASMLGDGRQSMNLAQQAKSALTNDGSRSHSPLSNASERFSHLKKLCSSDYYITNLQLARELAFIVCIALPPPRARKSKSAITTTSDSESSGTSLNKSSAAALLMTFNLKGVLMECTTIGQSLYGPRLGDVSTLQTTRDGEHLILNDSPTTLKIYRTFDLQPVYAYNTNDIRNTISDDQNRIKSLTLLDHKYILVGLENGKVIVYNADFKNLH